MLMTGFIGLYVGRIHAEVKRRPLYVVTTSVGFDYSIGPANRSTQAAPARLKAWMRA